MNNAEMAHGHKRYLQWSRDLGSFSAAPRSVYSFLLLEWSSPGSFEFSLTFPTVVDICTTVGKKTEALQIGRAHV